MDRKTLVDLLDDFAFGSHDIEQTADRITELYKETQALQLQQTGVMRSYSSVQCGFCGSVQCGNNKKCIKCGASFL